MRIDQAKNCDPNALRERNLNQLGSVQGQPLGSDASVHICLSESQPKYKVQQKQRSRQSLVYQSPPEIPIPIYYITMPPTIHNP